MLVMSLTSWAIHFSIYDVMVAYDNIKYDREKVRAFCETNGIGRLLLFGSVLTHQFGPQSDVDILVEFLPDHVPGFFGLAELEAELTTLFANRRVDLRTPQDLSHHFREKVLATAEVQYACG
jgi:predicted nucleotidyltransferase